MSLLKRTIIIKAQEYRTQAKNREAALQRLREIILAATAPRKKRKPTRPTRGSKERRITEKKQLSQKKQRRSNLDAPWGDKNSHTKAQRN